MAFSDLRATQNSELAFEVAINQAQIAQVTNRAFEQFLVTSAGQALKIPVFNPDTLATSAWNDTTVNSNYGDVKIVTVGQDRSVKYDHPDLDDVQTIGDIPTRVIEGAAKVLGREMDQHIISTVSGSGAASVAVTSYATLVDAEAMLADNGYDDDIWYFATPTQHGALAKDNSFLQATQMSTNVVENGLIRRAGGTSVARQAVNPVQGIMFDRRALAFLLQRDVRVQMAPTLGGSGKLGTRIALSTLYEAAVLDPNGVLLITNS